MGGLGHGVDGFLGCYMLNCRKLSFSSFSSDQLPLAPLSPHHMYSLPVSCLLSVPMIQVFDFGSDILGNFSFCTICVCVQITRL